MTMGLAGSANREVTTCKLVSVIRFPILPFAPLECVR